MDQLCHEKPLILSTCYKISNSGCIIAVGLVHNCLSTYAYTPVVRLMKNTCVDVNFTPAAWREFTLNIPAFTRYFESTSYTIDSTVKVSWRFDAGKQMGQKILYLRTLRKQDGLQSYRRRYFFSFTAFEFNELKENICECINQKLKYLESMAVFVKQVDWKLLDLLEIKARQLYASNRVRYYEKSHVKAICQTISERDMIQFTKDLIQNPGPIQVDYISLIVAELKTLYASNLSRHLNIVFDNIPLID